MDLWYWTYVNSINKNIPDFSVEMRKTRKDTQDSEEAIFKDQNGKENYLYIRPDKGIMAEAFSYEPDFDQFMPYTKLFLPVKLNFSSSESQSDVIISTRLSNDNQDSPYFHGKAIIEIKRRLNTKNSDDIKINKGDSILFRLFNNQTKDVGFDEAFRLNF